MRPITYTLNPYLAADVNAVVVAQLGLAGVPLTLVGVGGGPADPFILDVPRTIELLTVGSQVGNNFLIRGAGTKGNEIYESMPGPGAVSTQESELVFSRIYSITPQFDTVTNVTFGIISDVPSPWFPLDYIADDAPASVALFAPAGSAGVSAAVQITMDQLGYNNADPRRGGWHGSLFDIVPPTLEPLDPATAITLAAAGNDAAQLVPNPVTAVRFLNTGQLTAGSVTIKIVQGVRNVVGF